MIKKSGIWILMFSKNGTPVFRAWTTAEPLDVLGRSARGAAGGGLANAAG